MGNFETQITFDLERFSWPTICEVVPDYVKKSKNFEEFKLKKDYWIQKIARAGYAKAS